jgi:predicted ribosomally synthesized peptide with nif11-like leader
MTNLTPELIAKAKAAKSSEDLIVLAKANHIELTEDEAKTYWAQLNENGAISDEELDLVAGGCGGTYQDGDIVKFFDGTTCDCGCSTCRICVAPNQPQGAYLRCTNCQAIVFTWLPYDRFKKV